MCDDGSESIWTSEEMTTFLLRTNLNMPVIDRET